MPVRTDAGIQRERSTRSITVRTRCGFSSSHTKAKQTPITTRKSISSPSVSYSSTTQILVCRLPDGLEYRTDKNSCLPQVRLAARSDGEPSGSGRVAQAVKYHGLHEPACERVHTIRIDALGL